MTAAVVRFPEWPAGRADIRAMPRRTAGERLAHLEATAAAARVDGMLAEAYRAAVSAGDVAHARRARAELGFRVDRLGPLRTEAVVADMAAALLRLTAAHHGARRTWHAPLNLLEAEGFPTAVIARFGPAAKRAAKAAAEGSTP